MQSSDRRQDHAFPDVLPAEPRSAFCWASRVLVLLSALLLAGCDYPIASQENVDVCALGLDAVTQAIREAPSTEPGRSVCVFHTAEDSDARGSIQVSLVTRAETGYAEGVDQALRMILAEAEQAFGHQGVHGFADLPNKTVAVAFGANPPEFLDQVVVAERGVLMEISISGELSLNPDELATLTRSLWGAVTSYKPPSG